MLRKVGKINTFIESVFLFEIPVFLSILRILSIDNSSNVQKIYVSIVTFIVLMKWLHRVLAKSLCKKEIYSYIFGISILLLYGVTSIFYSKSSQLYYLYYTNVIVYCIPGIFLGTMYAYKGENKWDSMIFWIEKIMYIITIAMLMQIIMSRTATSLSIRSMDGFGMTYQSISYYSIYAFAINVVISLFDYNYKAPYKKIINSFMKIIQIVCALIGGGRGAIILLILILAFLILKQNWRYLKVRYLVIGIAGLLLLVLGKNFLFSNYLINRGLNRISVLFLEGFSGDGSMRARTSSYSEAFNLWVYSPLWGYGIGSVWMKIGFYTHNIGTDLLVESGLIGIVIMLLLLFVFIRNCSYLPQKKKKSMYIFMMVALIPLLFSNYYLSSGMFWFLLFWGVNMKKRDLYIGNC